MPSPNYLRLAIGSATGSAEEQPARNTVAHRRMSDTPPSVEGSPSAARGVSVLA
jgi:hypothetical protein